MSKTFFICKNIFLFLLILLKTRTLLQYQLLLSTGKILLNGINNNRSSNFPFVFVSYKIFATGPIKVSALYNQSTESTETSKAVFLIASFMQRKLSSSILICSAVLNYMSHADKICSVWKAEIMAIMKANDRQTVKDIECCVWSLLKYRKEQQISEQAKEC